MIWLLPPPLQNAIKKVLPNWLHSHDVSYCSVRTDMRCYIQLFSQKPGAVSVTFSEQWINYLLIVMARVLMSVLSIPTLSLVIIGNSSYMGSGIVTEVYLCGVYLRKWNKTQENWPILRMTFLNLAPTQNVLFLHERTLYCSPHSE